MPRTKGSLNKKKQIKEEAKEKIEKEIKALTPEIMSTMDADKLHPKIALKGAHGLLGCHECSHVKEMHYGGHKGHCNTPNCPCLEFK